MLMTATLPAHQCQSRAFLTGSLEKFSVVGSPQLCSAPPLQLHSSQDLPAHLRRRNFTISADVSANFGHRSLRKLGERLPRAVAFEVDAFSVPSSPPPSEPRPYESNYQSDREAESVFSVAPLNDDSFYSLLGFSTTSVSVSDIKVAYRQLVRRYHPDLCYLQKEIPQEECTRRFLEVQEAYETLSDPRRRALYDYEMMHPSAVKRGGGLGHRRPWQRERRPWEAQHMRWTSADEQAEAMKGWKQQVHSQMSGLKARRRAKAGSWAAQMQQRAEEPL
eukprot:TRINITY_DN2982_c0_g1_i1.p1 TRINITY_DN2982_c0_g1~~TRINITY_DN2982_c0_g1_i1.p1  ORF type:complete len:277 (+),score=30.94 TRINITY_DN2982_c0_g1_i1:104-934(+)